MPLQTKRNVFPSLAVMLFSLSCHAPSTAESQVSYLYTHCECVHIIGYTGDAMEPFLSRDGRYLLFNNSNDPAIDTNLHYAERIDDLTFQYQGEVKGVNSQALDGVPTLDRDNTIYFISLRSYQQTLSTIYRGIFSHGQVSNLDIVAGISRRQPWIIQFDVEVSADGNTLYFAEGRFNNGAFATADIIIAARHDSAFERAQNSAYIMQHINSSALEYAPCISADACALFFTRSNIGPGGRTAIYVSTRHNNQEPFSRPLRLAALEGFVEAPALSPDERFLYFHKKEGDKFYIYRARKAL